MNRNYRKRFFILTLFAFSICSNAFAQGTNHLPLIPYPMSVLPGEGSFSINNNTSIRVFDSQFQGEAELLDAMLEPWMGKSLLKNSPSEGNTISLRYDHSIKHEEGYRLVISGSGISLYSSTPAGMFRGIQTIRQLLPATIEKVSASTGEPISLPQLTINDEPRYEWRGTHLDVSRHFFSTEYLKKLIDLLALYKMNKLHLHLTDDQGWRIEIKKYPKLTSEGAWRKLNNQDSVCIERSAQNPEYIIDPEHFVERNGERLYGGFYTQEEMRGIVKYAMDRHIEIIPEIDMPGHMMAAITPYLFLSCEGNNTFGEFFSTPICPCLPSTFQFAEDVFTEIMDIFPSKYIHIGGDEVDRTHWEAAEVCKQFMTDNGMKSSAELQSYFIRRMESFFRAHGKILIGWDDILEGGVSNSAVIMYWRTWVKQNLAEAMKTNRFIMASDNPLYFSRDQDRNSLKEVYMFDPLPKNVPPSLSKQILGAQSCLWTEYIPSTRRADFHLWPGLSALSEKLWSTTNDYESYLSRLEHHYPRLDRLKVNYRLPDLDILERYAFTDKISLDVRNPLAGTTIRYTTDGSLPTNQSRLLSSPLKINKSTKVKMALFRSDGSQGEVYDMEFRREKMATPVKLKSVKDGLLCDWYHQPFRFTTQISGKPGGRELVPGLVVPDVAKASAFTLQFRGYIDAPEDDVYTFFLTSDDGAVLRIAGREVVNNDGYHAPKEKNGQVVLKKGLHKFELDFVEGGGGYTLKLKYSRNGSAPQDVPSSWFKHANGN